MTSDPSIGDSGHYAEVTEPAPSRAKIPPTPGRSAGGLFNRG